VDQRSAEAVELHDGDRFEAAAEDRY
jgi:hypothetical protein